MTAAYRHGQMPVKEQQHSLITCVLHVHLSNVTYLRLKLLELGILRSLVLLNLLGSLGTSVLELLDTVWTARQLHCCPGHRGMCGGCEVDGRGQQAQAAYLWKLHFSMLGIAASISFESSLAGSIPWKSAVEEGEHNSGSGGWHTILGSRNQRPPDADSCSLYSRTSFRVNETATQ